MIAALSLKGQFVSLCLSSAQLPPSSYLYYFAQDLHSKSHDSFTSVTRLIDDSVLNQKKNLKDSSLIERDNGLLMTVTQDSFRRGT